MNQRLESMVAVGQLVTSAGVVVSLLFVGYELGNANKIQQAENDNLMYELMDSLYSDIATTPELVQAEVKLWDGVALSPTEAGHHAWRLWRHMNLWELAYDRHAQGFLSAAKWKVWDRSFRTEIIEQAAGMSEQAWQGGRMTYGTEFAAYVDEAFAGSRK
jgi:hypothetical protein